MKYLLLLVLCCFLASAGAQAQSSGTWRTFINQDEITSIDKEEDFFWIGTTVGLIKFYPETGEHTLFNSNNSPLPVNYIRNVKTSRYGGVWLMTDAGLLRHKNGWTLFSTKNSELPSDIVYDIVEDPMPNVFWLATQEGLARFNGVQWTIYNVDNSPIPSNFVTSLAVDSLGGIWAGTFFDEGAFKAGAENFGGLARFDGNEWTVFTARNMPGVPESTIGALEIDAVGDLWIGSNAEVARYDGLQFERFDLKPFAPWILFSSGNTVSDIAIEPSGTMWFCTRGLGVIRYHNGELTAFNPRNSDFAFYSVSGMQVDREGQLWFGCYGGMMQLSNDALWVRQESFSPGSISGNTVMSIGTGPDNEPYIFTTGSPGFQSFDGNEWYGILDTMSFGSVRLVEAGRNGEVWLAHSNFGLGKMENGDVQWFTAENSGMLTDRVSALRYDRDGNMWVSNGFQYDVVTNSGREGGLARYDGSEWTSIRRERRDGESFSPHHWMAIDTSGLIWTSTAGVGLALFRDGEWSYLDTSNSNLPSNSCRWIEADRSGRVYVVTWSGLSVFEQGVHTLYTPENSPLPSLDIRAVAIDKKERVWIGTSEGLARFDGENWRLFTVRNSALLSNRINGLAIDKLDRVWVGTQDAGVAVYSTSVTSVESNRELQSARIRVYPQPASDRVHLTLNSSNPVTANVYSLNGRKVAQWTVSPGHNSLSLGHLAPGVYYLRYTDGHESVSTPLMIAR